jgi:SNF2 family DNA or RNA helicase
MEIIDNKYLAVRTRNPNKITDVIEESQVVDQEADISTVAVEWDLKRAQQLTRLEVKNVPSPILRDYDWPGLYTPFQHQRDTGEFLTLHPRAYCFNEQGTGKTGAAIWASDYLMKWKYIRRVLVVCPLSIMQAAWQRDLFNFATHRSVGIAHGTKDKRQKIIEGNYDYVIINFDGVEIVADAIAKNKFDLIIIDEANAYKTTTTKRWRVMKKLVTEDRWLWLMTGTPAAQSPADAYGLAKLCTPDTVPKFFGAWKDAVMTQISRFKWIPKVDAAQKVHTALQPAIRFAKKDCLDLPPITYIDREAPLTAQQKKYYDILKKDFLMTAGEEEITSANVAVNINKLLQISGGAVYTNSGATAEFDVSNRLKVVEEAINEASHKVLVFVPFSHTISLLRNYLASKHIPCEVIAGDVSATKRNDIIQRFQTNGEDDLKVLVIQPAAAAHGVTLTAADTIIWYAPCTSIETYLQANARIDRQGQKNPMTVIHIAGSQVENRLYAMLRDKLGDHTKLIDLYNQELTE